MKRLGVVTLLVLVMMLGGCPGLGKHGSTTQGVRQNGGQGGRNNGHPGRRGGGGN